MFSAFRSATVVLVILLMQLHGQKMMLQILKFSMNRTVPLQTALDYAHYANRLVLNYSINLRNLIIYLDAVAGGLPTAEPALPSSGPRALLMEVPDSCSPSMLGQVVAPGIFLVVEENFADRHCFRFHGTPGAGGYYGCQ